MDYKQPDFYRFNEDSLLLVKSIVSTIEKRRNYKIIDLCAGCGVIGIELARSVPIEKVFFIEKQRDFRAPLLANIRDFLPPGTLSLTRFTDISSLSMNDFSDYDFCLMNPPYYLDEKSRGPHEIRRKTCRFISMPLAKNLFDTFFKIVEFLGSGYCVLSEQENSVKMIFDEFLKDNKYKKEELYGGRGIVVLRVSSLNIK